MSLYDCLIFVSFGGPEQAEDVMPFLERVTHGKRVSPERLAEVAEHYYHLGGASPINAQNRALIGALASALRREGIDLPIYFGNKNWKPFIRDALADLVADGYRRPLAFFTSMYSCYSGCRQYREHISLAIDELGLQSMAVDKLRFGFNHPLFIEANVERIREVLPLLPGLEPPTLVFTAHSIPRAMAEGCSYERQLQEAGRLVAEAAGVTRHVLAWQSRSGAPGVPWLEPDVNQVLAELAAEGLHEVAVCPLGFVSDHVEVLYDLDVEARDTAQKHGLSMVRAPCVGTHPSFVSMIVDLIRERMRGAGPRAAIGDLPAWHDVCPVGCCPVSAPAREVPSAPPSRETPVTGAR
jgi:ferrochelatase